MENGTISFKQPKQFLFQHWALNYCSLVLGVSWSRNMVLLNPWTSSRRPNRVLNISSLGPRGPGNSSGVVAAGAEGWNAPSKLAYTNRHVHTTWFSKGSLHWKKQNSGPCPFYNAELDYNLRPATQSAIWAILITRAILFHHVRLVTKRTWHIAGAIPQKEGRNGECGSALEVEIKKLTQVCKGS